MFLLLLACATTGNAVRVDPDEPPVLPAPRAALYTRAPGTPRDPLVAAVAKGLPWDEALSGAATGVALAELGGDTVDSCRLRWMAVLAGYPYPLLLRSAATTAPGELPERLAADAKAQLGRAVDVGLIRARGRGIDRWVLLVGEHRGEIPTLPREVQLGDTLPVGPGEWVASDPYGDLHTATGSLRMDIAGEWLLAARSNGATVATFPVYVGEETPSSPPMLCAAQPDVAPEVRVAALLRSVRDAYTYPPLAREGALDSVARVRLRAWVAGEPLPAAEDQLRSAGYVDVPVAAAECRASTVEACVSSIWWSPEGRGVLVGDITEYGLAVERTDDEVRMVLVGAG